MTRMRWLLVCVLIFLPLASGCVITPREEHGNSTWSAIARTPQGRSIDAITIPASIGGAEPPRVLVIGSIHGNEPEGLPAVQPLVASLSIARRDATLGATVCIIRDLNPDATAARSRTNSRGIDLNRNFPASNFSPAPDRGQAPLSEPESRALARELDTFRPDLVIVFHSIRSGPFVNYDGPASALAEAFVAAARRTDPRWRVEPSMGYPTPGSLGTFVGIDRRVPILTVEFRRGHDAPAAARAGVDGVLGAIGAMGSRATRP
ncbi:MAG TPA: M14 family zinc carboxypeptidase [Phycisphaerales bacterium]